MKKMLVKFTDGEAIKIRLFPEEAPQTVEALEASFPQDVKFMHARFNGEAVFFKANVEKELPSENAKPGAGMKAGEVSLWLGSAGFKDKAIHFWYGNNVAGDKAENVFGELDGDIRQFGDLGIGIWTEGPRRATVSVIEE